jgi:hypothetical protein
MRPKEKRPAHKEPAALPHCRPLSAVSKEYRAGEKDRNHKMITSP